MTRGRLGAYSLWQLRDYFTTVAGVGTIALPFMLGVFPLLIMKFAGSRSVPPAELANAARQGFDMLVSATAWIGAMLSVSALVSADRQPGLTRFLFSKPVRVSDYYLQAWFVRGVSLVLIMLVMAQIINVAVTPVPWVASLAAVGISWALIGGVGLLLSVLTARDGLLLIVVYLAINLGENARKAMPERHWIAWILNVMPPMHKLEPLRHALLKATPMVMSDFWHVMIYGAACTALAAFLVRRLPLVR